MVDDNCVFCRIIGGEEMVSIVHEDDRAVAFMDTRPSGPGHTLIVSREHYSTLYDTPDDLASHCLSVAKRIAPAVQRATGAESVRIYAANGRASGHDVPHFHLHLLPVREGEADRLDAAAVGDAEMPTRSDLDIMAARISRAIQDSNAAPEG